MTQRTMRLLYWLPRVLGILFAVYISIFALDVFGAGYSFWEMVWALLMHLVPAAIVVLILVLAWHRAWVGMAFDQAFSREAIVWRLCATWIVVRWASSPKIEIVAC